MHAPTIRVEDDNYFFQIYLFILSQAYFFQAYL